MTNFTTSWHASSYQQTSSINVVGRWCLIRQPPWLRDNIPKSLEMKLSRMYQWSSFLDHQDGRRIAIKWRRTTLRHATRRQTQSWRNSSLHLQWTPIRQPRINKNQERLTGEEHATVRVFVSWIRWCKEKLDAREMSCSMDLKTMSPRRQCRVT